MRPGNTTHMHGFQGRPLYILCILYLLHIAHAMVTHGYVHTAYANRVDTIDDC